jgi:hypothetical protein
MTKRARCSEERFFAPGVALVTMSPGIISHSSRNFFIVASSSFLYVGARMRNSSYGQERIW